MNSFRALLLIALVAPIITAQAQEGTPLRLLQTIPLPNAKGRIDHLAVDLKARRLFIAAIGNDSVGVKERSCACTRRSREDRTSYYRNVSRWEAMDDKGCSSKRGGDLKRPRPSHKR